MPVAADAATQAAPPTNPVRIGVGIDTSRYGHVAVFLRDDLEPAANELKFSESGAGYAQLRERFEQLGARHGRVHFCVRLDAAGQYADNLLHFLHGLAARSAGAAGARPAATPSDAAASPVADARGSETPAADAARRGHATFAISCGDPQRNKNYRAAIFGSAKSDPVEARACARFALTERPATDTPMAPQFRVLRQTAGRLQAVVRQRTRLINQFHHLLALSFPELALLIKDIAAGWVLELCSRYPTLLVSTYRHLPERNYLDTIPGLGQVTAAILTAFIIDIDRFATPGQLVKYFGTLPIEVASGVDRDGQARGPRRYVMSQRGNDLVRRYLGMAALSAGHAQAAAPRLRGLEEPEAVQPRTLSLGDAAARPAKSRRPGSGAEQRVAGRSSPRRFRKRGRG